MPPKVVKTIQKPVAEAHRHASLEEPFKDVGKIGIQGGNIVVKCIRQHCYEIVRTVALPDLLAPAHGWTSFHRCGGCGTPMRIEATVNGTLCMEQLDPRTNLVGVGFSSSSNSNYSEA